MHRLSKRSLSIISGLSLGLSIALATAAIFSYSREPLKLSYQLTKLAINQPINVTFNLEVNAQFNYHLSPTVAGSWAIKKGLLGATGVTFTPNQPLTAGSDYTLNITGLHKLGNPGAALPTQSIAITTQPPAAIARTSPANNTTSVSTSPTVEVELTSPNHNLRNLIATTDAPVALNAPTTTNDTVYDWHFASALPEGATYHIFIDDLNQTDPLKRRLTSWSFSTVSEPKVVAATQTDHFYAGSSITVSFDQPMNQAGTIAFGVGGSGHWASSSSYVYTPTNVKPATSYSYTVPKGLASSEGGTVLADHIFYISTPGPTSVLSSSPNGNNVDLNTTISFTFDQPVNQSSAQNAFSITPAISGSFSWNTNTMSFHPGTLGYQTSYTATLAPSIISTYGVPSNRTFSQSFVTTYQVIKLAVPGYLQQYAQSCEESALRMALAYRGITVSDSDVLGRVGYNPRPRDTSTNTWDNPYTMFVGDVNGVQPTTGYGVFSGPIAAAAQSLGRSATAATGVSADWIATQILAGNPVIVWGFSSNPRADAWNTTSGVVQTYVGEHARTVYGVAGKAGNVIGFYIHDPLYGDKYWTAAQLMANLNTFGNTSNQAVVVF